MDFLKNLKIDTWYGIVLYLGVGSLIISITKKVDFLSPKYLFGFGLGCILVGIGFIASEAKENRIAYGKMWSWDVHKHNIFTIILIILGGLLCAIFGFKIIFSLL